jgi:DNA-binding NarL/FixJ family response regulator
VAGLLRGGDEGLELLREAAETLAQSPARLWRARALVDYGAALRRANRRRDCRAPLRDGLALAEECGATPLAERARRELAASGGRLPPRTGGRFDELTPSELRVAGLAAEGLSNPEIAQRLFVTIKTVEMHLSNAYRKLSISSRRDLPAALAPR